MANFKIGDYVVFNDNDDAGWTGSRRGHVYQISDIDGDGTDDFDLVYVNGSIQGNSLASGAWAHRFRPYISSDSLNRLRQEVDRLRSEGYTVELKVTPPPVSTEPVIF